MFIKSGDIIRLGKTGPELEVFITQRFVRQPGAVFIRAAITAILGLWTAPGLVIQRQLIKLTLYGAATGLAAGLVVLTFRWLIETSLAFFLPTGQVGDYESLEPAVRLLLPVAGGLVIGRLFERVPVAARQVGVIYVLARLRSSAGGQLSLKNFFVQFLLGTPAIVTDHSVDREGPGVHLGSTCGSFIDVTCRLLMGRESVFVALLRVFRSEGAERAERLT